MAMDMDTIRLLLYCPLGLAPGIFFGLRFLLQWVYSERAGRSVVPRVFWQLSLAGNLLLLTHYILQVQFPFALVQAINAVIAWRNSQWIAGNGYRLRKRQIVAIMLSVAAVITLIFTVQAHFNVGHSNWVRTPKKLWDAGPAPQCALWWHMLGFVGASLFASRFWIQWWESEKSQISVLGKSFWRLSLTGNIFSLVYFWRLDDVASLFNHSFAIIPAVRNLLLIRRQEPRAEH